MLIDLRACFGSSGVTIAPRRPARRRAIALGIEGLEGRAVPSAFALGADATESGPAEVGTMADDPMIEQTSGTPTTFTPTNDDVEDAPAGPADGPMLVRMVVCPTHEVSLEV